MMQIEIEAVIENKNMDAAKKYLELIVKQNKDKEDK